MDLVLIHPNGRSGIYQGLADLAAVEPPLWACMLASYARLKGHSVAIVDAEAEQLSPKAVAGRVAAMNPLLACVVAYGHQPSASTQVMPAAGETMRALSAACRPTTITMLLGGHVAALPERTWREESAAFVCTGEGPETIHRVLCALKLKGVPSGAEGLVHFGGRTPDAPLVEYLDHEIPAPAWDLLPKPLTEYRAHNWHMLGQPAGGGYASLYTTLGCPFDCSFCCIQAPFRSGERLAKKKAASYRRWSPWRVGETLGELANAGVRNVKLADEMFVLNPAHVEGVCDEILRRKLDLNLWAYARTDTVRDGMPKLLKKAGFNWLAFGIESGAEEVRDRSRKSLGQSEDIEGTLRKVREAGIHVIGNFIFGLPGETMVSMKRTLDFAVELNCEWANLYCAMAYPGSPVYEEAVQTRPWDLPTSWAGYSQHGRESLPLRTDALTAREIVSFRDAAFRAYYSSDRYTKMIGDTFGSSAVSEVFRMLAVKLDRA